MHLQTLEILGIALLLIYVPLVVKDLIKTYHDKKASIEANNIYPHLKTKISVLEKECLDREIIIASLSKRIIKIMDANEINTKDFEYFRQLQQYCLERFKEATISYENVRTFVCKWNDGRETTIQGRNFKEAFDTNYLNFEFSELDSYYEIT